MKMLVIQRYKDSYFALPKEKQVEVLVGAVNFTDKYTKAGKCRNAWIFSDRGGNASVWDYASAEEFLRLSLEWPLMPYITMESIPVVDVEDGFKILKEMMLAAQKKTP